MKILTIKDINMETNTIFLTCEHGLNHTWTRLKGFPLGDYSIGEKYISIGVMIYKMEFGL